MGFIIILPLSFIAGVFVPIAGMDAIPRAIADWDPLSALVATVRSLTTPGYHSAGSWQLDHPEVAMLIWCLLLMAICVPLALQPHAVGLASTISPLSCRRTIGLESARLGDFDDDRFGDDAGARGDGTTVTAAGFTDHGR
jgi:hypothetical protein